MSTHRTRLIAEATAAGYTATTDKGGTTEIIKRGGRWNKITAGVVIYPDGSAFDVLVPLECSRPLRNLKNVRKVLGIIE